MKLTFSVKSDERWDNFVTGHNLGEVDSSERSAARIRLGETLRRLGDSMLKHESFWERDGKAPGDCCLGEAVSSLEGSK